MKYTIRQIIQRNSNSNNNKEKKHPYLLEKKIYIVNIIFIIIHVSDLETFLWTLPS